MTSAQKPARPPLATGPDELAAAIGAATAADLRARGSVKWTVPGPGGFGAGIAEMDFGAAPPVLEALARMSDGAAFGYLSQQLADDLAAACAQFERRRYGWAVDPERVRHVPDVIKALEVAITHYSRPGSPVILPTPAYMPFLAVPPHLGRQVIQVPMRGSGGFYSHDLDAIADAYRAGGHLLIFCSPCNPVGRVFSRAEMQQLSQVVSAHGGLVFADEVHAPLVYPGSQHVPYASVSAAAAAHTMTAVSASKAWNLAGLKCAQVILSGDTDVARWDAVAVIEARGTSNPGVVANTAAYTGGEPWLAGVLDYLDGNRTLLAGLLREQLPQALYRPPDGTYLAWIDCTAMDLPGSPGELLAERAQLTVVDGPAFGAGGAGSFRFNFATPRPVLAQMVGRMSAALNPPRG